MFRGGVGYKIRALKTFVSLGKDLYILNKEKVKRDCFHRFMNCDLIMLKVIKQQKGDIKL